jgi:voltage-gated potassium channel
MSQRSSPLGLSLRRLRLGLAIISATVLVGTFSFVMLEGWSVFRSLYASILIIATLGFGSDIPATVGGRVVTVLLISAGVGTLYYLVGIVAEITIESQMGLRQERRMQQQISRLKNHVIVCGYGRVGQQVVSELQHEHCPFVVVETSEAKAAALAERGILAYHGDASEDRVLHTVGIDRARALIVCSGNDAVNVFITLSARAINEKLFIAARSIREDDEPKLQRAGANRVITPASLGGRRLVSLVLRPTVVEWLDVLVHTENLELWLEELPLAHLPSFHGKTLSELPLRDQYGITVLAIKRGQSMLAVLDPTVRFTPDDIVVALGSRTAFNRLRRPEE